MMLSENTSEFELCLYSFSSPAFALNHKIYLYVPVVAEHGLLAFDF